MMQSPEGSRRRCGDSQDKINLAVVQRDYLLRVLEDVSGRKALVLDKEAMNMFSYHVMQSELLHREVYLVEHLDYLSQGKEMGTVTCIVVMAPTAANINKLCEELSTFTLTLCHVCRLSSYQISLCLSRIVI